MKNVHHENKRGRRVLTQDGEKYNYHENERGSVVVVGWSQIRSISPRPSTPDPDMEQSVSHTPCSQ